MRLASTSAPGSTVVVLHGEGAVATVDLGTSGPDVPTLIGFDETGQTVFGERAAELRMRDPSATAFSFKRRVPEATPLVVGGRPVVALDLYADFLAWVVHRLMALEERAPAAISVTHPTGWRPQILARIAARVSSAGVHQPVRFVPEPVAALLAYSNQRDRSAGAVAVLDIGECSVVANIVRDGQVIGVPVTNPRVGGVDFDEAILDHVLRNVGHDVAPPDIDDPNVLTMLHALRARVRSSQDRPLDQHVHRGSSPAP